MGKKKQETGKENDHDPAWLNAEKDEEHRQLTAPLFGTGALPTDTDAATKDPEKGHDYGSIPVAVDDNDTGDSSTGSTSVIQKLLKGGDLPATYKPPGGGGSPIPEAAAKSRPHVPPQNPCLYLFHSFEGLAVVSALCLFATQIMPLFIVGRKDFNEKIGLLSLALKTYIAFFCLMFVATEINLPLPLVRTSPLLQNYTSRGVLYSFLGLICVEESYSERVKAIVGRKEEFQVDWVSIFMNLSSWLMLMVGLIYVLLGICCLKGVRDRMKEREKQAWRDYRVALQEWKTKYGI